MSEDNGQIKHVNNAPNAQVLTRRTFSIIWVVPVIALLIGGWLAFKAMSEKGPTITITFKSADGLEADKTLIKYKDVELGKVTQVELLSDLSGVVVTADMHKDAEHYLTENTRFWVVRARVAAGEVSGLGTLFSGAYIGISPSLEGRPQLEFNGLEEPPILTEGLPGRHFILESKNLGSLDVGAPVYYRGLKVGQVVKYEYDPQSELVELKVFVAAPYHEKVYRNTRFWNASGFDLTLDASGVKVDTQSLVTMMLGGVAFDLRKHDQPKEMADENQRFQLYQDRSSSEQDSYTVKRYYRMYFDQNVRGLTPGAPVEIKGIHVGEVVSVELQYDIKNGGFRIPVLTFIEPERMSSYVTEAGTVVQGPDKLTKLEEDVGEGTQEDRVEALIAKGFRAQLKTGNLLTGQLYIDLDIHKDAKPAELVMEDGYLVFPTTPTPLEQIVDRVDNILAKIERMPIDKIGQDLDKAIVEVTAVLENIGGLSGQISDDMMPKVDATLDSLQKTLEGLESLLGEDSALQYNTRQITSELTVTIRSIRSLLEYLERDPQALLLGKEGEKK